MNNMLAVQNQPQFISRIFTDQSGRQFRMLFLVLVVNGEFKGRLISAERLPAPSHAQLAGKVATDQMMGESGGVFCLPITCNEKEPSTEYISDFAPVVSPFFSIDFLITSQPTRAPSKY